MGGSYYEDGCAEKFSIWVKIWAGCTAFVVAIVFSIEVSAIFIENMLDNIILYFHQMANNFIINYERISDTFNGLVISNNQDIKTAS